MKQIKIGILHKLILTGVIIFAAGCGEDYLEVENINAVTTGNFYETERDAEYALYAAYGPIGWRGFNGNTFQFLFYCLDDRIIHENAQYELYVFNASDGRVGSLYYDLYKGVYRCNILLQSLPDIPMAEETKNLYFGQLYFLRGFYYFYLASVFYAPPLVTYATENPSDTYGNTPQQELYDFVEEEFAKAINLLPWEWENGEDVGRATRGAALGMLGKAHLYQQEWDEASVYLKRLIDEGPHDLMMPAEDGDSLDYLYAYLCNFSPFNLSTEKKIYKAENNVESVFSAQFNDGFSTYGHYWNPGWQNDGSLFSAYFGINGWRNVVPSRKMAEQYEAVTSHPAGYDKDPRFYASFFSPGDTIDYWYPDYSDFYHVPFKVGIHNLSAISQGYGLKKYCFPMHLSNSATPFQDPNNWRILRFSDVLLMYAEAEFHRNPSSADGLNALNRVRERVGMPPIPALTREAVIHERDIELFAECLRFFDLVRWGLISDAGGTWVNTKDYITNFVPGKSEYLPIPISEINVMQGKLQQNPGW